MEFAYSPRVDELRTRLQTFMDDSVYSAEAVYQREMEESGGDLRLVVGEGAVVRLLELTGVTDAFSISDTID